MHKKYVTFFHLFTLTCLSHFAFAQVKITQKGDTIIREIPKPDLSIYTEEYYYKETQFEIKQYKYTKGKVQHLISKTPIYKNKMHGNTTFYHKNGKVNKLETWVWENGVLKLIHRWYSNGNTRVYAEYDGDNRQGKYIYYHRNGQVWKKSFFTNDNLEGLYEEFDKRGRTTLIAFLHKGAEQDTTKFYKRGKLKYAYIVNRDGLYQTKLVYNSRGRLKKKVRLKFSDKEIAPITLSYRKVYPVDTIKNSYSSIGKCQGTWVKENKTWQRYEVANYNNGVLQGSFYFYALDKLTTLFRGTIKRGKLEGLAKGYKNLQDDVVDSLYFKNGILERMKLHFPKVDIRFKNDLQEGIYWQRYYLGGVVVQVPVMKGKLHGVLRIFNLKNSQQPVFVGQLKNNQWTKDTLKLYNAKGRCIKGYIHIGGFVYHEFIYEGNGSVKDNGEQVLLTDELYNFAFIYHDLVNNKLPLFKGIYQLYQPASYWYEDD